MIQITDPRIEGYLMKLQPEDDAQILAMEEKAREMKFPIIDRLVGRFLHLLTRLKQPKLVVELGSGFGYSALWFARALGEGAKVVLTEYAEKNIAYARQMFEEEGLADKAEFRVGNALEIGQEYDNIDILFIDIDKYQYPAALEAMLPRLAQNALVIADNTLWYGRVVEENSNKDSEAVKRFNELMFSRSDFFTTIVPLRDGVLLSYRI
ncbi:O-methyltransferase [Geotalea uraniireducens]|nr:O-methyltransferase [Geotalea uraniireducens]